MRCRHGTVDVHELVEREIAWHFSNGELEDQPWHDSPLPGRYLVRCLGCGKRKWVARDKVETAADWLKLPLLAIQQKTVG